MKNSIVTLLFLVIAQVSLGDQIIVLSPFSHSRTVRKIIKTIKDKGLTHFLSIDHHKGAKKIGKSLRPTTLIIFGNPKVGTLLMEEDQSIGIDLPLKILVLENEKGDVEVSYKRPSNFKADYNLEAKKEVLKKMDKALYSIASSVKK